MSQSQNKEEEDDQPVKKKGVRKAVDVQRYKLEKLMKNPVRIIILSYFFFVIVDLWH